MMHRSTCHQTLLIGLGMAAGLLAATTSRLPAAGRVGDVIIGPAAQPDALAPLNEPGVLIPHALNDEQYEVYQGVLGHYHVQTDKQDPGPAFQWDRVLQGARKLMSAKARAANAAARGKPARFIPSAPAPKKP